MLIGSWNFNNSFSLVP